jgi:sorbitol-specific phosphotransferase system component IIA
MLGEPRHSVDSKLIMVDTEADDFVSGVVVVVFTPGVPTQTEMSLVLCETCVTKDTGRFTESQSAG